MSDAQRDARFDIRVEDCGIIFIRIIGRPSIEAAIDFEARMLALPIQRAQNFHIMFDIAEALPTSATTRYHIMRPFLQLDIDRVVVLGANAVQRAISEAIFRYLNLTGQARYFSNEHDGRAWLLSPETRPSPPVST